MTDLRQRNIHTFNTECFYNCFHRGRRSPESVEDDGALVKLKARVQQLGGDDGGVAEARGLASHFLTVEDDVLAVSSEEETDGRHATQTLSSCVASVRPFIQVFYYWAINKEKIKFFPPQN